MQRTISLIAICAVIGCGGENGAGTDFAQHHSGREELAPDTFVPHPLCANNPIGSTFDPAVGLPSSAALSQLSNTDTKGQTTLRIGVATTNQHYATILIKNGPPVGPAIDISCRLGVKLHLLIKFIIYATLPDLLTAFRAGAFEIGWAFDPALADPDLALTNPYVIVPNTYAVAKNSLFLKVADVDVPRTPQVKVGTGVGNSPDVYLTAHLRNAQLLHYLGMTGQDALLAGEIDALASGRVGLITFAAAPSSKGKVRVLPDDIFYANLAPFMHLNNADGLCYLNDYLEAAKTSGLVLQALTRIAQPVIANGSKVAPAIPTCAPNARCHDVTVTADGTCHAPASIDSGSDDADSDAKCLQSPAGPFGLGVTKATLTCTDNAGNTFACTGNVTVVDKTPPVIICPANQTLECTNEGAVATFAPTATDNCGVAQVTCSPQSGTKFPEDPSPTLGTCTAVDGSGNAASCSFQVKVQDTLPPVVTTNPGDENGFIASLWPPNHSLQTILLSDCIASITDQCDGTRTAAIVRVTSDELVKAHGKKGEDMVIAPDGQTVQLRAERDGPGDGRVYTIFADTKDDDGNTTEVTCKVQVPHDQSGAPAIDSGAVSCVGDCPPP
ncbi:MAG: HYR domain-containing protein [Deltaproteobacteria bacterium]|nr:MAG: HYR domain-containing protein [Deltaproteobacteria bacterium]